MTAEIVDSQEADVVIDALIGLFQGARYFGRDKYRPFWQLLTPSQLAVIGKLIKEAGEIVNAGTTTTGGTAVAQPVAGQIANAVAAARRHGPAHRRRPAPPPPTPEYRHC